MNWARQAFLKFEDYKTMFHAYFSGFQDSYSLIQLPDKTIFPTRYSPKMFSPQIHRIHLPDTQFSEAISPNIFHLKKLSDPVLSGRWVSAI